jgi:hypothetical protein
MLQTKRNSPQDTCYNTYAQYIKHILQEKLTVHKTHATRETYSTQDTCYKTNVQYTRHMLQDKLAVHKTHATRQTYSTQDTCYKTNLKISRSGARATVTGR